MLLNFINEFLPKFNSFVSKQFLGLTKISDICNQCQMKTYSFGSYFFATFDLESILAQNKIPVVFKEKLQGKAKVGEEILLKFRLLNGFKPNKKMLKYRK